MSDEQRTSFGWQRIAMERMRQIDEEGYTPENDDTWHTRGELAAAGSCYAIHAALQSSEEGRAGLAERDEAANDTGLRAIPSYWPWGPEHWNPSDDPMRNLDKAGALIAAELDRLHRATS